MKTINGLKTIDSKKIKRTLKVQASLGWNYFMERELVENLVSQRFNYFIVAFSLFITAAATVEKHLSLIIILSLGIIVLLSLWLTILNSYFWLDIVLRILHNMPIKDHLFKVIREERQARLHHISVNKWISIIIPVFCLIILIMIFLLVITGVLDTLK